MYIRHNTKSKISSLMMPIKYISIKTCNYMTVLIVGIGGDYNKPP